jgi:glycosyltransferase involved in cell wall biosynthesis
MKIAIFSDNFYPELSGIADSIIALAKELAKHGHKIVFYVPKYSTKDYQTIKQPLLEIRVGKNIQIHRFLSLPFTSPTGQSRLVIPTALRWLIVKKFNPDIIHTNLFFGVGLEALLTAKMLKIPLVGTNHTRLAEFIRYSPIRANWVRKYSLRYMIWFYNHCDYVTAPSKLFLDEMKQNGLKQPNQVISNPVDLKIFKPGAKQDKQKILKKYKLSENTIIYAGRLASEKNIDVIIRALAIAKKKISNINLALAGHGSASQSLKNLTKQLSLKNNVKFLGTLDQPSLAKLYQVAKIFVTASTSEVQSMTILQAMACQLPVIGAKCNSMPELISQQHGFLFKPGDYRTLAEKIIFLVKHKKQREILSKEAQNFVQKFSIQKIGQEWEKLYNKVRLIKNNTSYETFNHHSGL